MAAEGLQSLNPNFGRLENGTSLACTVGKFASDRQCKKFSRTDDIGFFVLWEFER